MPTYITLARFTQQGAQDMKGLPERIRRAKDMAKAMGGEIKSSYATMGQYDLVTVFEAPDDETAAKGALALAMRGNISTETVRAFTESEIEQLVGGLP